jgi:hypothetical protein
MRRSVLAFAAVVTATVTVASTASAVGPGGWDHVGVGKTAALPSLNGTAYALNTQDPGVLYVGGNFTSAGGNTKAQRIAQWSGSTWSALGNTPLSNGAVHAIAYRDGKVYVGGTFINAGGNAKADFLAVFDLPTGTWSPFCNSTTSAASFTGNVNALQIIGNTLYVGGSFQNGAGIASADYLVGCSLTTGAASSTVANDGDFSGAVYALTADSNGTLYAGGQFINVAAIPEADHIAAYDGAWHAMGTGPGGKAVDDYVRGLTAVGTNVYVGTDSVNVAGIAEADHVARWNGSAWSALGSNSAGNNGWFPTSAFIYAFAHYGSLLIAAGSFQNANGIAAADHIAYFDGSTWRPIGSDGAGNGPMIAQMSALAVYNGRVFAAGNFTKAGGDVRAQSVAAYSLRQPDAWISAKPASQFVGNGVYSTTGAGQGKDVAVVRRKNVNVYIKIQNDGLIAASFTLKGTGGGNGISARYFRGSTNVTRRVLAGTYPTGSIAPRSGINIRMRVHATKASAKHATFIVRADSLTSTAPDAVRAKITAH